MPEQTHDEMMAELKELKATNYTKGSKDSPSRPRRDGKAVPQELVRIAELERLLKSDLQKSADPPPSDDDQASVPLPEPEPTGTGGKETPAETIARLEKEKKGLEKKNRNLQSRYDRSAEANKIKNVEGKIKYVKRAEEIMAEALSDAEDREPIKWDDSNRLAVEREIRKFVRKGGSRKNSKGDYYDLPAGFKKGITDDAKKYALDLLEKMGRLTGNAADIFKMIIDGKTGKTVAQKRQSAKDINFKLQDLGVSWDDSIQVPGMNMSA